MTVVIQGFFLIFGHFLDAVLADILPAVGNQTPGGTTEHAGRFKLLQDDPVILHVDFQFIPLGNVQRPPEFNGEYDSS